MNLTYNYKKYLPKVWSLAFLLLATFVISLTLSSNPFSNSLPRHDSSMFTYFGYAMDKGQVMYKDIFDHKGPLIFFINFFGAKMTSEKFVGIYVVEIISIFLFLMYSFKTARIWLSPKLSFLPIFIQSIMLMIFLEGGNFTEEYALPFISYSIYIFMKFYMKDQKVKFHEIFFIGASFGAVILLRPNMVAIWGVFCLLILVDLLFNKKYLLLITITGWFTAGLISVFLPVIIYLNHFGALDAGIFQAFTFNFMYLGDSDNKEQGIMDLLKLMSSNYVVMLLTAMTIITIYKWKMIQVTEKKVFIGSIVALFLSFLFSVMSGRAYPHYLMAVLPSITVPIVLLLNLFSKRMTEKKLFIVGLIFIPTIFMTQIYDNYNYLYEINITNSKNDEETEILNLRETKSRDNQQSVQQLIEVANIIKQNTATTDRIYTHRFGGNIYLLSNRLASIKYFNLPAIDINENRLVGDDFLNDLKNSNTELVVLETTFKNKEKVEIEEQFFEWVSDNYGEIYEENNYTIYLKN